jgi:putative tricarboxylic transport membrane protein
MTDGPTPRYLRPESLTAIATFVVAAGFLIPTAELSPISALLPFAMLGGLMVLSIALLIVDQRKAAAGKPAEKMTQSPLRVLAAFAAIAVFVVAVHFLGFYPCTIVSVPLVAWTFGYRSLPGLALATLIVVGGIYLIFSVAMAQDFPPGILWAS